MNNLEQNQQHINKEEEKLPKVEVENKEIKEVKQHKVIQTMPNNDPSKGYYNKAQRRFMTGNFD